MRRLLIILAAVVLLPGWALAQGTGAKLGDHDLSTGGSGSIISTETGRKCVFCHAPHVDTAQTGSEVGSGRPLWNHTLTTQNLTWTNTTTVRGSTLPTTITGNELEGSRACLSCHDGTVAVGSVLRVYNTSTGSFQTDVFTMASVSTLTNGMMNSNTTAYFDTTKMAYNHPIGVEKPTAKTGFTDFVASDPSTGVWYRTSSNGTDYVQCGSCHNPHLTTFKPFLRISNNGSAICLSCHDI